MVESANVIVGEYAAQWRAIVTTRMRIIILAEI